VANIEVIDALTSTNLRTASGSGVTYADRGGGNSSSSGRSAPAGYHYMPNGTLMANSAMPGGSGSSGSGSSGSGSSGGGSYGSGSSGGGSY